MRMQQYREVGVELGKDGGVNLPKNVPDICGAMRGAKHHGILRATLPTFADSRFYHTFEKTPRLRALVK
jgi:hypothetical protein